MKKIQEKVKDLIAVGQFQSISDFAADPAQTLIAYQFTPETSDIMARWLDQLALVGEESGLAKAVAGYRGVGKSHFLATFAAIVSMPELRSRISDNHVSASASQIKRKRYPLVSVKRGSGTSLFEEIKTAASYALDLNVLTADATLADLIDLINEKATDTPFVIIIDTDRTSVLRVERSEDEEILGNLAELVAQKNIFLALALDDDIVEADGKNTSIALAYSIDYLSRNHLYQIINTAIFVKTRLAPQKIGEVYNFYRSLMPAFRWSEQRFSYLYPLHPILLEIAPYISLYTPDFSILKLASEIDTKFLGRPANSLLVLDEVFDKQESFLRNSEELKNIFATYDKITTDVVDTIPVLQRLKAKLVLKALVMLSLKGIGTTATEISTAMLIYNETDQQNAIQSVKDLLETFYKAAPEAINRIEEDSEVKYGFRIGSQSDLITTLASATKSVQPEAETEIIRRFAKEIFSDWTLEENTQAGTDIVDCVVTWRGSFRRGRVLWNWNAKSDADEPQRPENVGEYLDWEAIVNSSDNKQFLPESGEIPRILWQSAALQPEEQEIVRRYHILINDEDIKSKFANEIRTFGYTYQIACRTIWRRIFLEEGKLFVNDKDITFTDKAKQAQTLSELFTEILAPIFDGVFAEHPVFEENLSLTESSIIISEHFSGAKPNSPEVQSLVSKFAQPLGLVSKNGEVFVLENDEKIVGKTLVKEVMKNFDQGAKLVSVKEISMQLKAQPYGLAREAQHLILGALAAQRKIELLTQKGDRINHRSLDLNIVWDDIANIALPPESRFSRSDLAKWAGLLTDKDSIKNLESDADLEAVRKNLDEWLTLWKEEKVLERFDALPDEMLNLKVWNLGSQVRKTFGVSATAVEYGLENVISIEESLQRIGDAFVASEEEFGNYYANLSELRQFLQTVELSQKVRNYLSVCEAVQDEEVNELYKTCLTAVEAIEKNPLSPLSAQLAESWETFHGKYSDYFAIKHDLVMKSYFLQDQIDEILSSEEWWEFDNLSKIGFFQQKYRNEAKRHLHRFMELNCPYDVREMLKTKPYCACSFRLSKINSWEQLPFTLHRIIEQGRINYRRTLELLAPTLAPLLENFANKQTDEEPKAAALKIADALKNNKELDLLNNMELAVLSNVSRQIKNPSPIEVAFPKDEDVADLDDLNFKVSNWIAQFPSEPFKIKL